MTVINASLIGAFGRISTVTSRARDCTKLPSLASKSTLICDASPRLIYGSIYRLLRLASVPDLNAALIVPLLGYIDVQQLRKEGVAVVAHGVRHADEIDA